MMEHSVEAVFENTKTVTVHHRANTAARDREYLIASAPVEGEWLRMEWRSDVPHMHRKLKTLGIEIRQ